MYTLLKSRVGAWPDPVFPPGIDPAREKIPIAPAEHYHMGGLWTDARGKTSLPGLWAAGEAASTGLHGANRLASNSLLEAVVFGDRVASDIAKDLSARELSTTLPVAPVVERPAPRFRGDGEAAAEVRKIMTRHVGVLRDAAGLSLALRSLLALHGRALATQNLDLRNRTEAALLIAASAFRRRESRGGHFRSDFPVADPAQAHRSFITLDEALRLAQGCVSETESKRA